MQLVSNEEIISPIAFNLSINISKVDDTAKEYFDIALKF